MIVNAYATYRECGMPSLSSFSFSHARRRDMANRILESLASECIWLHTCNRVELYLAVEDGVPLPDISSRLEDIFGSTASLFSLRADGHAEEHLFKVSTMLDSMIVGEQQILGQLKAAVQEAEEWGMMGPVLRPLVSRALRAGKRARTETSISSGNVSMASVAVAIAEEYVGTLLDADCLVLGAGKISRMIAKILFQKGATRVHISNRTDARALALAEETGATPIPFSSFAQHLPSCDVLFCASSAPHSLIQGEMLRTAVEGRASPLVIVDVALPPDVSEEAASLGSVTYFGLEDVRGYADVIEASRVEEIPLVERIIEEEIRSYKRELYLKERKTAIRSISTHLEEIRSHELERLLSVNDMGPEAIEAFSRSILKKAFHTFFLNIQDPACPPELVHAARELLLFPYSQKK